MLEKEKRIKDQRYVQATRNNLIGIEGKIGSILKFLGSPITDNASSVGLGYTSTPFDNGYEEDSEEIPHFEEDDDFTDIGLLFSGLSRGYNIDIQYLEEDKSIKLFYNGNLVYQEIENDLMCYIPDKNWEQIVDYLYKLAKEKQVEYKKKFIQEQDKEENLFREKLLAMILKKWGK